jgi:hypothetical protein
MLKTQPLLPPTPASGASFTRRPAVNRQRGETRSVVIEVRSGPERWPLLAASAEAQTGDTVSQLPYDAGS